ncbi:hypothetical protein B1R94_26100 [Mycolicibacterium litorale]|nr:hypothetical protein B1R94_26100 [Mycolicibacterium litorale]
MTGYSSSIPKPATTSAGTWPPLPSMPKSTAYRRGLCVDCQQVAPAAGMTRCYLCHSISTGTPLPRALRREALIRSMAGTCPGPLLRLIATIIADRLLEHAPQGQT